MGHLEPEPSHESGTALLTAPAGREGLRDISSTQWKSGLAAWLGWMFDGLDMHLYTLVALPFVAELMRVSTKDPQASQVSSWIQGGFLLGWALGGGFFGRLGDKLGRTRALMLTILTYALFTGLSFFATTWWHLFIFRFLAALGIGGEWAVGASLLSETWPSRWRPWLAAVLQTGVNLGVLLASLTYFAFNAFGLSNRSVFLVGVVPALLVFWIRRAVPESAEWEAAQARQGAVQPRIRDLFRGSIRRTTILTILVCTLSLTPHWSFMFWGVQHLRNLMRVEGFAETDANRLASHTMTLMMIGSMVGNFLCAGLARWMGYRRVIVLVCLVYFGLVVGGYSVPRPHGALWWFILAIGLCQGLYGLFTMYLPPLFPTLLRTTGAGFCYNIGRSVAAIGTVAFGQFQQVDDYRWVVVYASLLFLPAAAVALFLPEKDHVETPEEAPVA